MKIGYLTSKQYQEWIKLQKDIEHAPDTPSTIKAMAALKDFELKHGI